MSNNGAIHSALSDIHNIQHNLLEAQKPDQQTGLMFLLKEIVQNADDCKAKRLGIGWSDGLPDATHPLLHGPAIVAVNNGHFSKRDARGIRGIGLSTKENDSSAVGKFGQGLKTVFLICEAFFYLTGPDVEPGVKSGYILNLWSTDDDEDDVPVSTWDNLPFAPVDQALMADERSRMGLEDGFTLWIPLRLESHCIRGNSTESAAEPIPIMPRYFDDGQDSILQEFQNDLADEVAELLPLLKHVKQVQIFNQRGLRRIELVEGSQQCVTAFEQMSHMRQPLKGAISICDNSADTSAVRPDPSSVFHTYKGFQQRINQPHLEALKKQRDWPTTIPVRADAYKRKPQKAEPHCAVVLHARPAVQTSRLSIRWAVFLPTAEMPDGKPIETYLLDTIEQPEEYVITLHGFFFLQSDRRRIRDWSSDHSKNGVLQTWNQTLAEQGTLRLILPTLEVFAREQSPQSVKVLTQALQSSDLYKTYRRHICAEGAWLCTLNFNEQPSQLQWRFERTTSPQNLLTIPESTFEQLPEIFPNLAAVCRDRIVTFKEWPRLASSDHRPRSWSPEDIGLLLQGVTSLKAAEICADNDSVEALCTFLTHALGEKQPYDSTISNPLTKLLRHAFATESFQPADNLKELVAKLPSQLILGLPNNLPETLYTRLLRLATECLVVPGNLAPSDEPPQLSEQDAYELLNTLKFEVENSKAVEDLAIKIFNRAESSSSEIWQQICQLRLFKISEILSSEEVQQIQSFDWISQRQQEKRIFSAGKPLARSLAAAIQEPVYLLNASIGPNHLKIPLCNDQAVLELFTVTPIPVLKTDSQARIPLLREILKHDLLKTSRQKIARYLLHASPDQFENLEDSLYESESLSGNSLWANALKLIIGSDQSWRFVDKDLLKIVGSRSEQSEALKIDLVNHEGVENVLRKLERAENSLTELDWSSFNREDRMNLIKELPTDLLRTLKLHEPHNCFSNQPLVAIGQDTYLAPNTSDFPISLELAEDLGIILLWRCDRSQDIAQKQEQVSPPISAREVVERILRRSDRAQYWREIMDAIGHSPQEISAIESLRSSSWLPLEGGQGSRAPENVIHLPIKKIQDELERICDNSDATYIASSQLSTQVQKHKEFKTLRDKLFPSQKGALEMLAEILLDSQQYYVGSLREIINSEDALTCWLGAFNQVPTSVMPAYCFLNALRTSEALELFSFLAEPIEPSTRVVEILKFLVKQHPKSDRGNARAALLETYKQYLQLISNNIEIICQIRLLSQAGEWRRAQDLCIGESIAPQYVLHEDLQGIIATPPANHSSTEISDSENSFNDLITYFESWPHRTRKAIGILLRILSGLNQDLQDLSCQYLQDVDRYLECLHLREQNDAKFRNATSRTKFNIILNRASQHQVTSLAGTPLTVQTLQSLNNLIVGQHRVIRQNEYELTFQVVPIEDTDRLIAILKNTFQHIVEAIYEYKISDFDIFWGKVNLTGIDIRVARHILLDSGILSLRSQINPNLGARTEIVRLIREYSELQKRKAKLEILGTAKIAIEDINNNLIGVRERIGGLLCEDSEAQDLFLNAVKQKISNASYDESSILFELFQNADDAYCELSSIGGSAIRRDIKIGCSRDNNELWISHWGRGINQDRCGNQVCENRGYDDDLLKMLLLNFSDKAEGATGKFGLGFKSVFLASNRPKVVSGTLGLEVIGAVYPRELTRQEFDTIERCYLDSNADEGTAIVLPEIESPVAQSILSFFEERAPYLIAFSRWIKTIAIAGINSETACEWFEERIQGVSNVYYGISSSENQSFSALLLGDATRRCLIGLDTSGFTPLPASCPTFWVTTPTRMFLDVGIAVNAPFHPDIGRSQLDLSGGGFETNKALAQEIGHEFGQALVQLFQTDETNHKELCQTLGLHQGVTQMKLWGSLWNILGTDLASRSTSDKGIELLRQIFWAEGCGMKRLLNECDALPTGLINSNDFNCLTRPSKVRWVPDGILSQDPKSLIHVFNLPVFREGKSRIKPGQIVSQDISEALEKLGYAEFEKLTLCKALSLQIKDTKITASIAHKLEGLISITFIDSLVGQEKDILNKFLQTLLFESKIGEWKLAKELLVYEYDQPGSEEFLLSQFAPESSLLSINYRPSTLFFNACRSTHFIDPDGVGQWILDAQTDKHGACVLYLVTSKNRNEVITSIKSKAHTSWLKDLKANRALSQTKYGISPYKLDALLYELDLLQERDYSQPTPGQGGQPPEPDPPTQDEIKKVLNRILQYWRTNKTRLLQNHEADIYFRGDLKLTKDNCLESSNDNKRRWLFLFMRAILYSSGRTTFSQHREFLRFCCEDWGWLDVMISESPHESDWLNLLNEYFSKNRITNNLPYYQWVRYYPAFYAISKWWLVYRDSLLQSNERYIRFNPKQREIRTSIDLILNPQNNPIFQGTSFGHDAPPIGSILGMGSTFVIRELLRAEILINLDLIPFAYVPAENVRKKLLRIGCDPFNEKDKAIQHSQHIYSFLKKHIEEDATFDGGYDLPFFYYENI